MEMPRPLFVRPRLVYQYFKEIKQGMFAMND